MTNLIEKLQKKNYNPCGTLTGREVELCELARKSYFDLPFVQVMRNIVIAEIGAINPGGTLENADAIKSWSERILNSEELKASLDFDAPEFEGFSALEVGLCKYAVHVLRENRYNIFYNRLVDYCAELDEKFFATAEENGLTFDVLENEIDALAKEGNFSMTFNNLTDEFLNFLMSFNR